MKYDFHGTLCTPAIAMSEDGGEGFVDVRIPWSTLITLLDDFVSHDSYIDSYPELLRQMSNLRNHLNQKLTAYDRRREMDYHIGIGKGRPYDF